MPKLMNGLTVTSISTSTATTTEGTITNVNNNTTYEVATTNLITQQDIDNYIPSVGDVVTITDVQQGINVRFKNKTFYGVTFKSIETGQHDYYNPVEFIGCRLVNCEFQSHTNRFQLFYSSAYGCVFNSKKVDIYTYPFSGGAYDGTYLNNTICFPLMIPSPESHQITSPDSENSNSFGGFITSQWSINDLRNKRFCFAAGFTKSLMDTIGKNGLNESKICLFQAKAANLLHYFKIFFNIEYNYPTPTASFSFIFSGPAGSFSSLYGTGPSIPLESIGDLNTLELDFSGQYLTWYINGEATETTVSNSIFYNNDGWTEVRVLPLSGSINNGLYTLAQKEPYSGWNTLQSIADATVNFAGMCIIDSTSISGSLDNQDPENWTSTLITNNSPLFSFHPNFADMSTTGEVNLNKVLTFDTNSNTITFTTEAYKYPNQTNKPWDIAHAFTPALGGRVLLLNNKINTEDILFENRDGGVLYTAFNNIQSTSKNRELTNSSVSTTFTDEEVNLIFNAEDMLPKKITEQQLRFISNSYTSDYPLVIKGATLEISSKNLFVNLSNIEFINCNLVFQKYVHLTNCRFMSCEVSFQEGSVELTDCRIEQSEFKFEREVFLTLEGKDLFMDGNTFHASAHEYGHPAYGGNNLIMKDVGELRSCRFLGFNDASLDGNTEGGFASMTLNNCLFDISEEFKTFSTSLDPDIIYFNTCEINCKVASLGSNLRINDTKINALDNIFLGNIDSFAVIIHMHNCLLNAANIEVWAQDSGDWASNVIKITDNSELIARENFIQYKPLWGTDTTYAFPVHIDSSSSIISKQERVDTSQYANNFGLHLIKEGTTDIIFKTMIPNSSTTVPAFQVKGDMVHTEVINGVMATGYAYATNDVTIKNKNIIMQDSPSGANRLKFQNCDIAIADGVIIQGVDFTGSALKMYGPYFGQTEVSISDSFIDSCSIDTIAQIIKFGSGVSLHRSTVSGDEVWWGVTTSSTNTITSSFSTVKAAKNIKFGFANNSGDYTIESSHFEAPSITISQGADRSVEVKSGSSIKAETLSQTIHPVFTTSRFSLAIDSSSIIEVNKSGSGYLKLEDYTNSGNIIFDSFIDATTSNYGYPRLGPWSISDLKFDTQYFSNDVLTGLSNATNMQDIVGKDIILLGVNVNSFVFRHCNIKTFGDTYFFTDSILKGCTIQGYKHDSYYPSKIEFKGCDVYSSTINGVNEIKLIHSTTNATFFQNNTIHCERFYLEDILSSSNTQLFGVSNNSVKANILDAVVVTNLSMSGLWDIEDYAQLSGIGGAKFTLAGRLTTGYITGSDIVLDDTTTVLCYNNSPASSNISVEDPQGNNLLTVSNAVISPWKHNNGTVTDLDQV